jgi:serine/threonine-protein kinase
MNLPIGHYLQNKKYRLFQVVGQGGFGITYKGILFTEIKGPLGTIKTEVPISIKEYFFKDYCYRIPNGFDVNVHSETGQLIFCKFKEKLIKEAKILSDVHYPYIVNVLDVFEENNTAYIVMEYIDGYSLKYILERDGILQETKVLKYTCQIGKALQFVHGKNILHLDIKPSNILIDKNDNARLIDFGVSKRYDVENTETSTTMLTLSKGFASVEQYDNEGTHVFSPCPDIYSLGATMYNLLTGKIPTESILRATRPFPKPSELNPNITAKTESVILKAMQINPADRYQTLSEMLSALGAPPVEKTKENDHPAETHCTGENEEIEEDTLFFNTVVQTRNKPLFFEVAKKEKRKRIWVISLISTFVTIGALIVMLAEKENNSVTSIDLPPATQTEENVVIEELPREESIAKNNHMLPPQENIAETDLQENAQSVVRQPSDGGVPEIAAVLQPTAEDIDAEYAALIASGKEKMNVGNYEEADADFSKAMSIKPTEEVKQWFISINEKQIEDRNALYEEKTTFGKYKIVRKILTGKYGAIDNRGEERILCQYKYTEKAGANQAFQRDDNLYDIYNTEGVLIKSGATYW